MEIGPGPGYLQSRLGGKNYLTVGLDESMQMIRLAKNRLEKADWPASRLVRGFAQALPFANAKFDTVISTFPSEYIFLPNMPADVHRVLSDGGRLIVLPTAWIIGRQLMDRTAAWLFQITGETPKNIIEVVTQRFIHPLEQAGFKVERKQIEIRSSIVLILIASKE